jgi:hypothetical protein
MDEYLKNRLSEMPDKDLLDLYLSHRDEYTEEAVAMMKAEMVVRKIEPEAGQSQKPGQPVSYSRTDFTTLEHAFPQVDILLVQLMLRESGIPFFVQVPPARSSVLPVDGELMQNYTLNVLAAKKEQAQAIINEHFSVNDGVYARRNLGGKDRLRSISFNEIPVSELEMAEEVEVDLSAQERSIIEKMAARAINEADAIETRLERGIFFYDNLEVLCEKLKSDDTTLTRGDLLAILEVLQIFCDEPDFPESLEKSACAIIEFLSPQT